MFGFNGINEARRRKILAEEQAHNNPPSHESPKRDFSFGFVRPVVMRNRNKELRRAEDTYIHSLGTEDEKQARKEYKQAQTTKKETEKIVKERNKPIIQGVRMLFSSKREFGTKPKPLKIKAAKGIYHSPFAR